jgi:signal transduction histidine kinase
VPPAELDSIFEPFYTTKPGGTGLGLPISSNIIKEMGGTLTVENLYEPARVRFIIAFPASNGKTGQE